MNSTRSANIKKKEGREKERKKISKKWHKNVESWHREMKSLALESHE